MESRYMTDLEWRICHAVNIYVFKNGNDQQTPILVHIPPARKKTMQSVMDTVQERVSYPVGYAKTLFTMDGRRIRHPCELEMYNNYVVASNFEKSFKCVEYGRKRSPLLVLNRYSKHIRVLRLQNENYDQFLHKKQEAGSERPQYVYPERYVHEGVLPQDLPVDKMGNTYVPNCIVDPNEPNYAKKHGMRKIQLKKSQPKNYTVNAFTIEQDPIGEYLQHAEPNEIAVADTKQFKKLGQDQVFYQPQKKWRTKGIVEKKKDENLPLFPTASDVLNANPSTHHEDDIEDIADLDEDNNNEAEIIDEVDHYNSDSNTMAVPSSMQPTKVTPKKREKIVSFAPKPPIQHCYTEYAENHGVRSRQWTTNQQHSNYMPSLTVEQNPPVQYLQQEISNEMQQDDSNFTKLGQDQVFYQPHKLWIGSNGPQYVFPERYNQKGILLQDLPVDRIGSTCIPNCDVGSNVPDYSENQYVHSATKPTTNPPNNYAQSLVGEDEYSRRRKGAFDNKKLPLFPRPSDMSIDNSATGNEEDKIEDITESEENNCKDVEVAEEVDEDYGGNTVTVTVSMREKKGTGTKKEKSISFTQKKGGKSIAESYKVDVGGEKRFSMREKYTQTESD